MNLTILNNDRAMMESPAWWPHRTHLALRRGTTAEAMRNPRGLGFVVAASPLRVVVSVMWPSIVARALAGDVAGLDTIGYESVDAMIADGWRVD